MYGWIIGTSCIGSLALMLWKDCHVLWAWKDWGRSGRGIFQGAIPIVA